MKNYQRTMTAVLLGGAASVLLFAIAQFSTPTRPASTITTGGVQVVGDARIGGPFSLVNQHGERVDESLLQGKTSFVFFGFTYCPDICPLGLQKIDLALDMVGEDAADVQTVFISIDPARDTPEALASYLSADVFPDNIVGLTGTEEEVAAAARAYGAFYAREDMPGSAADYLMNHSTQIYLMGPDGALDRLFTHASAPSDIAAGLRDHLSVAR